MATLLELRELASAGTSDLRKKVITAITIKAQAYVDAATPTEAEKAFALAALRSPEQYEQIVLNSVLADNAQATTTQISNADDASVQTAVNTVVEKILVI